MKLFQIFIITFCMCLVGYAQNGINYKALIKDANGNVLSSSSVTMQFIIYEGAVLTNNVYQESHTINTDANGFVVVNIGKGTTGDDFNSINWSADEHYLNVQADIGSGLVDLGTTQFMAVPYALSSGDHPWTKDENGIHSLNQNVGINIESPEHTFDIRSNIQSEPSEFNLSNNDKSRYLRFFSGSQEFPDPSVSWIPGNNLLFATFDDTTFDFQEKMRISSLGDVGIGITNPEARLDIRGGDWNLGAGNPGDLRIGNETNNFRIGIATGGGGAGITRMYTNSNALILGANDTQSLLMEPNGEVKTPNMTMSLIESGGDRSLVTKEYVDDAIGSDSATKTIVIPASGFRASQSSEDFRTVAGRSFFVGTPSSSTGIIAPITLPVGSVISEFEIHLEDSDDLADLTVRYDIRSLNGSIIELIPGGSTRFDSSGHLIRTISPPGGIEILPGSSMSVRVQTDAFGLIDFWSSNLGVYSLKITYTE